MQGDLKATIEAKKKKNDCKFRSKSFGDALGLYVHVPLCPTACDFCAFYQEQTDRAGIESYMDGIELSHIHISRCRRLITCRSR